MQEIEEINKKIGLGRELNKGLKRQLKTLLDSDLSMMPSSYGSEIESEI